VSGIVATVIAIALVHYEAPALALACVRSVLAHPPTEDFEIIVVDNGSSPEAVTRIREIDGARVIETGRNGGFAVGVNRCFREASSSADVVVLLNPDTEIRSGAALDQLVEAARVPGVALAAPTLLGDSGRPQRTFHRSFPSLVSTPLLMSAPIGVVVDRVSRLVGFHPAELTRKQLADGAAPAHVMGAVMAISRRAWETVGPFDERFFLYLEETEWQARANQAGLSVRAVPAAEVMHLHSGGDLAAGVPSIHYVDSFHRYLVMQGHHPVIARGAIRLSLATSVLAFAAFRLASVALPRRRAFARASLAAAVRAFNRTQRLR
jgi:N-acetylglucosaminyl-diphospho-decaprenol L-rhamnosyltransferase